MMDVVRLGVFNNGDPDYLPDVMIENYTSMVWTERFDTPGDFELKTPFVNETLDILPTQTLISHRETREVMMVESHSITTDDNGVEELTVVGRTVDCMLESRFVEGKYGKKRKMARSYNMLDAALVLVWQAVANDTGTDVTRERQDDPADDDADHPNEHDGDPWPWNTKDVLPNVAVSDGTLTAVVGDDFFDEKRIWLTEGMLYPQLQKIMDRGNLGLRTVRPPGALSYGAQRVHVGDGIAHLGEVYRDVSGSFDTLMFEVFVPDNRTVDQAENSAVVFQVVQDHIDQPNYLWSVKDWKTGVEIRSSLNRKQDVYRAGQSGYTGWNRRMMDFDAGEPDLPTKPTYPGKNASDAVQAKYEAHLADWQDKRDAIYAEFEADYSDDALRELNKHRKITLFSGDIAPAAPYTYKTDYKLGDTVSLRGDRGLNSTARVTEYVRTEDAEGDRGFPGLEIV